jgi:outer membrane receptor protein involved in Fe transport
LKSRALATSSIAALGLALSSGLGGVALADDEVAAERIVVTGSRIPRRDFTSSSPIVTVDSDTLQNQSTIGIETALNQLPQFSGQGDTGTQFGLATGDVQPNAQNSPGVAFLNLRGLGPNRSLVLIDGRRGQPSNASLAVDVNTIPAGALESIEVITGGASAVYGADALAGVVNFRLRQYFEGLELDGQYGITERSDGEEVQVGLLIGANFGDGRGNAMFGANWAQRSEVKSADREFFRDAWFDPLAPAFGSDPFLSHPLYAPADDIIFHGSFSGSPNPLEYDALFGPNIRPTGAIGVNPDGTVFLPNSTIGSGPGAIPNGSVDYTGPLQPTWEFGGNGALGENFTDGNISLPMKRYAMFGRAHFDLTDTVTAFLQATGSETVTETLLAHSPAVQFWGSLVPRDAEHPVPAELAQLLDSRLFPNNPWALSIVPTFLEPRQTENTTNTYQILTGLRGELPINDWTWEVYGSHGKTNLVTDFKGGFYSTRRWQALIQAPFYGEGFTFSQTQGQAASCTSGLPIFDDFEITQDCLDALEVRMATRTNLSQDVVEANLEGGLFDLPAGEVRFAAGAGYRENTFEFVPDPILDVESIIDNPMGLFAQNNTAGAIDVAEVYGELLVPLLSDLPLVQSLNAELGFRYSDYSTAGGVETYKILGDWSVTDWLLFRGGFQHANRAPNIAELFQAPSFVVTGWPSGDPCVIQSMVSWGNNASNPNRAATNALCAALIERDVPGGAAVFGDGLSYVGAFPFFFPLGIDVTAGNADLVSEVADTYTIGAVFNLPVDGALGDLTVSIDYYDIDIEDAILPLTGQVVYEQCFNSNGESNPTLAIDGNPFCDLINRELGTLYARNTDAPYANVGGLKTSGIDVTVSWSSDFADIGLQSVPGALGVNVQANFLEEFQVSAGPGSPFLDYGGTTGLLGTTGAQFDYQVLSTFSYSAGPATVGLRWRHLPEIDNVAIVGNPNSTVLPTDSHDNFDLFGRWTLNEKVELRGGVDNLMDEDPELVGVNPGINSGVGATDSGNYDVLGRRFYVGATLRY